MKIGWLSLLCSLALAHIYTDLQILNSYKEAIRKVIKTEIVSLQLHYWQGQITSIKSEYLQDKAHQHT